LVGDVPCKVDTVCGQKSEAKRAKSRIFVASPLPTLCFTTWLDHQERQGHLYRSVLLIRGLESSRLGIMVSNGVLLVVWKSFLKRPVNLSLNALFSRLHASLDHALADLFRSMNARVDESFER